MRNQFHRLFQIYEKSNQSDPEKNILSKLFGEDPPLDDLSFYLYWESLFQKINEENWRIFKTKVVKILSEIPKPRKGKLQIIGEPQKRKVPKEFGPFQCLDTFNEVHGYLFLKDEIGCSSIQFLEESKKSGEKMPDLEGRKDKTQFVLDIKTINTSDDDHAHKKRVVQPTENHNFSKPHSEVLMDLKCKICKDIKRAKEQLNTFPQARKFIYLVIDLDLGCDTSDFHEQLSNAIRQDIALVNRDVTICGKFQSNWRPKNEPLRFNWSS